MEARKEHAPHIPDGQDMDPLFLRSCRECLPGQQLQEAGMGGVDGTDLFGCDPLPDPFRKRSCAFSLRTAVLFSIKRFVFLQLPAVEPVYALLLFP